MPRWLVIIAMLTLGGLAAFAATPNGRGPILNLNSNVITMAQGTTTNILFSIQDDAVGWSGIQTTTVGFATNGIFANSILSVSNFSAPYTPPPGWTNAYSLETNKLTIIPGNTFGTNQIVLISVDLWGDSTTNKWTLDVVHVSQPPSFTVKTNNLVVQEESGLQTKTNFLTGITNGAGNPPGLTWKFSTYVSTTTSSNGGAYFTVQPAITNNNGSNKYTADLVFAPQANSYGSNLVSVVMTDLTTPAAGGMIASTNTFWLVVSKIAHPPVFTGFTNQVVYENKAGVSNVIVSVHGDMPGSTLGLSVISPDTNKALASVTSTNVTGPTNAQFFLSFTPALNASGNVTNTLIASQAAGGNTLFTTNYVVLTITHVSQPPIFTLASNAIVVAEESSAQTDSNFVRNISSGLGNPATSISQFTLVATTQTNAAGNAQFTAPPVASTNGSLTFTPKPHSFGTNVVTVTLTDNAENTNNGGVKTFSTNFLLEVTQISHVPTISPLAPQTVLENGGGTNIVINVWNYDAVSNNLALAAVSAGLSNAASVLHVSWVATNAVSATNTQFTLHLAPLTNSFGTNVISLTASELVGTASTSSTNFRVVVSHVTQPPSFVFSTTNVTTTEQASPTVVTVTNFLTSITNGPGNAPSTNWSFALKAANAALFNVAPAIAHNGALTFTPTKQTNGTSAVTVTMTDTDPSASTANGGVITYTNTFNLAVTYLSQTPSFSFATNTLVVPEESAAQTNVNFVTAINPGLGKAAGTTWTFTTVTATNDPVNDAQFTAWPAIATNGTLTFTPLAHSYGTNQVTVVMTDSGGTNGSVTNSFYLDVAQIAHAPGIMWATNLTTFENSGGVTAVVNVWDYDAAVSNLVLTAVSQNTNLALVSVTATNVINPTNVQFTLAYTPVADAFGAATIGLTAGEVVGTNFLSSSTNLTLTVAQVSQPPSFAFASNIVTVAEHAEPNVMSNFLTGITVGAGNQPGLTWTFSVTPHADPANVAFAPFQSPTFTTNGTLYFDTLDYSYGTNLVTVVMTDSGIIVNGGVISFTNSFTLQVPWVNQAPSFNLGLSSTTVDKYNVPVVVSNAAINILPGPSNENNQTVVFHTSNSSPSLFVVQPQVDPNGTLTFTPGDQPGTVTVQIYAQDNGGTANGGVDSSTNLSFTINIPANTFQNATGTYASLFYGSSAQATTSSGYVSLTLTTNGAFTGYLLCGSDSNAFNGQFDIAQSAASVQAGNYLLNLTNNNSSLTLNGAVSNSVAGWSSPLRGYLSGYGTALDGTYLMVMPGFNVPKIASVGDSTFYITNAGGITYLTGDLADSNVVTQVSPLCTNGYCPVYIPLYTNASGANGVLIGWLNFNGVAQDSVSPDSDLVWLSNTNATSLYANSFTNHTTPLISTFVQQAQILPINVGYIEMSGGDLAIPVVESVTIVNNVITPDPTVENSMTLTINTNTGEVSGSFVDAKGHTEQIESVVLQNSDVAQGYFLGTGPSGSFILVANAVLPQNPPFPAFTGADASGATIVGTNTPTGITNLVMLENTVLNPRLTLSLYDPLTSTFTVTVASSDPSVLGVSLTGSGLQRQLLFAPVANKYETNITVTVTADDGTLTNTFVINATVSYVNQAPSFTLATTTYKVDAFGTAVSLPGVATGASVGPASEAGWQTISYVVTNNGSNLFLVQPEVDASGTLTFTPGTSAGTITVGVQAMDSGGTDNNGTNTSASQLLTITIPANPFTTLLSQPSNTNTFTGLFSDPNATPQVMASSGYFSLTLTNDGSFTGFIINAGATNPFTGQFSISETNATVAFGNYTLNLTNDPAAGTVFGTVVSTSPSWTANLQSYIETTTSLNQSYLVSLPGLSSSTAGPVGNSIFTVVITPDGVATLAGDMADNTSVSLTSHLSAAGNCPIYTPIYTNNANTGLLFGWLTFTNDSADNLTAASSLTWFNNSGATPEPYAAGFTNNTMPVANIYADQAPNELPDFSYYVVLTGGSYGATLVTNVVTLANDTFTVDPSVTDGLSLAIDHITGAITGSFVDGAGKTNYINSVILQNNNTASGYFTSADGTLAGSFALFNSYTVPAGDYAYPETIGLTNVTLLENQSAFSLNFTVFDPLAASITSVTATSSNPNFVTVSASGTGTACTLVITPVANTFTNQGNGVVVSVVVSDGTLTSTNTIDVQVLFVNQAPTFTLNEGTVTVDQYHVPVSLSGAVTAITVGQDSGGGTVHFNVTNNAINLFTAQPAIDGSGTLTFTPGNLGGTAVVTVVAQDDKGTNNGGIDSSTPVTFNIYIPPNAFQNVTGTNLTGTLTGLFMDTNGVIPTSSGYVTVTVTNDGGFNITFLSAGATNSVNSYFSVANTNANVNVGNYKLGLMIDTGAGTVTGTVTNTVDSWVAELQAYLAATPEITPGAYMVSMAGFDDVTMGPIGYSVFNVGINSNGVATLAGFMADNTPVSQTAMLSAAGYCPIYIPLYPTGTNGLLIGWLTFTNDPANDSLTDDSSLTWFKTAGTATNVYRAGFTNEAVALASPYATNADYANDLTGSTFASGYGYVMLSGGDLGASPVVKKLGITNNIISVLPSKDTSLSLNINTNSGLIEGWYIDTKGYSNNIESAIFQNDAFSAGYFIGVNTNQCGLFMLFGN